MNDSLQEAFNLRKNQEFQKAIDVYQPIWQKNKNSFDDWAGWSYAFSLSKLRQHDEALEICRTLYPRFKNSEILNSLYAKCIYYTQFATDKPSAISVLKKALEAMFRLSPPNNEYSLTPRAVFKLIKRLLAQQQINWSEIEKWLLKLDPDLLDDRPFKMIDSKGRPMELASTKEEWYSYMIRAKGGLDEPRELLEVLEAARKQNIRWHYNNDIWFARKKAFALAQLGERTKAEKILREIVSQKREWFLLSDLAGLLIDDKEALSLLCEAALARGKHEMKIKLYGNIHKRIKDIPEWEKETRLHAQLMTAICHENDWNPNRYIQEEIIDNKDDSRTIIKSLTPFWKQQIINRKPVRIEGRVIKIFPDQKGGIVIDTEGKKYIFWGRIAGNIHVKDRVTFELILRYNKTKKKKSKKAVNLEAI